MAGKIVFESPGNKRFRGFLMPAEFIVDDCKIDRKGKMRPFKLRLSSFLKSTYKRGGRWYAF
jgi:hypothetical protein